MSALIKKKKEPIDATGFPLGNDAVGVSYGETSRTAPFFLLLKKTISLTLILSMVWPSVSWCMYRTRTDFGLRTDDSSRESTGTVRAKAISINGDPYSTSATKSALDSGHEPGPSASLGQQLVDFAAIQRAPNDNALGARTASKVQGLVLPLPAAAAGDADLASPAGALPGTSPESAIFEGSTESSGPLQSSETITAPDLTAGGTIRSGSTGSSGPVADSPPATPGATASSSRETTPEAVEGAGVGGSSAHPQAESTVDTIPEDAFRAFFHLDFLNSPAVPPAEEAAGVNANINHSAPATESTPLLAGHPSHRRDEEHGTAEPTIHIPTKAEFLRGLIRETLQKKLTEDPGALQTALKKWIAGLDPNATMAKVLRDLIKQYGEILPKGFEDRVNAILIRMGDVEPRVSDEPHTFADDAPVPVRRSFLSKVAGCFASVGRWLRRAPVEDVESQVGEAQESETGSARSDSANADDEAIGDAVPERGRAVSEEDLPSDAVVVEQASVHAALFSQWLRRMGLDITSAENNEEPAAEPAAITLRRVTQASHWTSLGALDEQVALDELLHEAAMTGVGYGMWKKTLDDEMDQNPEKKAFWGHVYDQILHFKLTKKQIGLAALGVVTAGGAGIATGAILTGAIGMYASALGYGKKFGGRGNNTPSDYTSVIMNVWAFAAALPQHLKGWICLGAPSQTDFVPPEETWQKIKRRLAYHSAALPSTALSVYYLFYLYYESIRRNGISEYGMGEGFWAYLTCIAVCYAGDSQFFGTIPQLKSVGKMMKTRTSHFRDWIQKTWPGIEDTWIGSWVCPPTPPQNEDDKIVKRALASKLAALDEAKEVVFHMSAENQEKLYNFLFQEPSQDLSHAVHTRLTLETFLRVIEAYKTKINSIEEATPAICCAPSPSSQEKVASNIAIGFSSAARISAYCINYTAAHYILSSLLPQWSISNSIVSGLFATIGGVFLQGGVEEISIKENLKSTWSSEPHDRSSHPMVRRGVTTFTVLSGAIFDAPYLSTGLFIAMSEFSLPVRILILVPGVLADWHSNHWNLKESFASYIPKNKRDKIIKALEELKDLFERTSPSVRTSD